MRLIPHLLCQKTSQLPAYPLAKTSYLKQKQKRLRQETKPEQLQNRNVRGVGGKLPLDPERINMSKDAVFKFYAAPSSGRDSQ